MTWQLGVHGQCSQKPMTNQLVEGQQSLDYQKPKKARLSKKSTATLKSTIAVSYIDCKVFDFNGKIKW